MTDLSAKERDRDRDRKKSAHWTEEDTQVLVDTLMRYKDSGRTQDNGFKPEVWKEAAELVKGSTSIGGPKTPEACKSRWQRLQRDFKVIKELELLPGLSWDRTTMKLSGSQEAWDAADKTAEASKCSKIHLPTYDSLCILCPPDPVRMRQRSVGKPRSSLGAMSDTSSLMSTMSVGNPQTPQLGMNGTSTPTGANSSMVSIGMGGLGDGILTWDTGELDGDGDFEGSFTMPDGQILTMFRGQKRLAGFDSTMMGSTPPIHLEPRQSPPKRQRTTPNIPPQRSQTLPTHLSHQQLYGMGLPPAPSNSPDFSTSTRATIDAALMPSPNQSMASASLQAVTGHQEAQHLQQQQQQQQHLQQHLQHLQQHHPSRQQGFMGAPDPAHAHAQAQAHAQHQQQLQQQHQQQLQQQHQQQQQQQGSQQQQAPPQPQQNQHNLGHHPQQHPQHSQPHQHPQPQSAPHQQPSQHQHPHQTPQAALQAQEIRYAPPSQPPPSRPTPPPAASARVSPTIPTPPAPVPTPVPSVVQNALSVHSTPAQTQASLTATPGRVIPRAQTPSSAGALSDPAHRAQVHAAGLSEAQRRTEAILQLQAREIDMSDDDLVEVLAEFEGNVAAADTYLAIQRDGLRRMYLGKVVKRRKSGR